MNPTAAELAHLTTIVEGVCAGGVIQKVTQPAPTRVVLKIRKPGAGTTRLLIDLTRNATGFHPTQVPLQNPKSAPPFCLALRSILKGAWITRVHVTPDDRVVILDVRRGRDAEIEELRIVIELVPSHPTLIVVDGEGTIAAVSDGSETARRTLRVGATYVPLPPNSGKPSPAEIFPDLDTGFTDEILLAHLDEALSIQPGAADRLNALRRAIAKKLARHYKRVAKVEEDSRRATGADTLRAHAEILKAHLFEVERGSDTVTLPDYTADDPENATVTITIDPGLTPQGNVEAMFTRARKKERGRELAAERLTSAREELAKVSDLKDAAENDQADIEELTEEAARLDIKVLEKLTPAAKKNPKVKARVPWLGYESADGLEIRVGRTSRDNDVLTFRHANGNEWWLHAQDYAGSHVVVKTTDELPEQTLLDAATLAVRYSKAAFGGKQSVSYTRRKHVTKFKGAASGKVMLSQHRTILIRIEPDRLTRLESNRQ